MRYQAFKNHEIFNVDFWKVKLEYNQNRDKANIEKLHAAGWRVIVVWECEIKKAVRQERLARLSQDIISLENAFEEGPADG